MEKIKVIIQKEWAEVFKNKMVVSVITIMPLLFTAMMLGFLYIFSSSGPASAGLDSIPEELAMICKEGTDPADCVMTTMMNQFLVLYILVPMIIPINIAAYSIVGEKTRHSLEPLLATPITVAELLMGKILAAVIPAVLATWAGFVIFGIGTVIISGGLGLLLAILDVGWLAAILLLGPLLAVLAVSFCLIISSKVNDPRVAEQISSLIVLPVLLLMFGQISGVLVFSSILALLLSLAVLLIDAVVVYFCVQLFARETILTRWK